MTTAPAVSRMKGARGAGVAWGLGGHGGLQSEHEQRCHGPTQPEGLEGSEKQDLEPWLASAHSCLCQHVRRQGLLGAQPTAGTEFESLS